MTAIIAATRAGQPRNPTTTDATLRRIGVHAERLGISHRRDDRSVLAARRNGRSGTPLAKGLSVRSLPHGTRLAAIWEGDTGVGWRDDPGGRRPRGFLKRLPRAGLHIARGQATKSMFWTDQQNYQMNAGKHLHRPPSNYIC